MYTFADRGRSPEGNAGVVRAVNTADRGALPVKLCYAGPVFPLRASAGRPVSPVTASRVEAIGRRPGWPQLPTPGSACWVSTGSGWKSPSLGDELPSAALELLAEFCLTPISTRTPAGARRSTAAGARRQANLNCAMTASAPVLLDHLSDVAKVFDTVLAHLTL